MWTGTGTEGGGVATALRRQQDLLGCTVEGAIQKICEMRRRSQLVCKGSYCQRVRRNVIDNGVGYLVSRSRAMICVGEDVSAGYFIE